MTIAAPDPRNPHPTREGNDDELRAPSIPTARPIWGLLDAAQPKADPDPIEAVARVLASERWPYATAPERERWAEAHWNDHLRDAQAILAALRERGWGPSGAGSEPTEAEVERALAAYDEAWVAADQEDKWEPANRIDPEFVAMRAALLAAAPQPGPITAEMEAMKERDAAYVRMIDVASFLRGNGDVCDLAARRLVSFVPEDFDEREEACRALLEADAKGGEK